MIRNIVALYARGFFRPIATRQFSSPKTKTETESVELVKKNHPTEKATKVESSTGTKQTTEEKPTLTATTPRYISEEERKKLLDQLDEAVRLQSY